MKHLQLAVIGAGHWGPNLIRNFHENSESKVRWVSDLDRVRLEAIRANYDGIRVTEKWEEAIADPEVDAAVISTPTSTHYTIAKAVLKAGKHVFVEKPLATTAAEARELVEIADAQKLKLMVGHVFLFNPGVRYIKDIVDQGGLGDLFYLYCIRTNLGPVRGDVNALWDLAPHDISILLYLLGGAPTKISAMGSAFINPPVEDVVFAHLRYPSGLFASLHVSWLDPKKVRQLVVVGSDKMLVFDDMTPEAPLKIFDKSVAPTLSAGVINDTIHHFRKSIYEGKVTIPEIGPFEPLKNEVQAFLQWVLHDVPQPSTGAFGAEVVEVMERIDHSMKQPRL
jgi:predicted dehydrogenase